MNPFDDILNGEPVERTKTYKRARQHIIRLLQENPERVIARDSLMFEENGPVIVDLVEEGYLEELLYNTSMNTGMNTGWYEYVLIKPIPENYE